MLDVQIRIFDSCCLRSTNI